MSSNLTILALTGGIATGKSTCCAIMQVLSSEVVVFDADQSVASLHRS
ncbi:MAG: dephospho-CoA kinase [Akkermansiaceae bacterium]